MKEYRLQYLNDKEFEALSRINPRYANTKDDAGFADMVTNRIFVRKSGNAVIDQFVTNHEIEEILAKNSSHEDEFKIRHKKGKDVFSNIIPAVVGLALGPLGPLVAGLGAAGTSAITQKNMSSAGNINPLTVGLSGLGAGLGASAMGPGVAASKAATTAAGQSPSYIGQVLTGAQQALGFQSGAQKTLEASKLGIPAIKAPTLIGSMSRTIPDIVETPVKFGGAVSNIGKIGSSLAPLAPLATGIANSPGIATSALGFQGPVTQPQSAQGFSNLSQVPQTQGVGAGVGAGAQTGPVSSNVPKSVITPAAGAQAVSSSGQVVQKTSLLKSLLGDNWRQTLLGASIPLLGQSSAPMFGATPTPEPFTPEQSKLFQETVQMVKQGPQVQLNPGQKQAITVNYDDALEQARQNLMDRYKMLRPGSDIENDSQFRGAMIELESDFAEKRANALAGAELGLSAQQTQMMGELANMEIGVLSQKAGIKYQEAKDFKDMLSSIGFMVATAGQPIYSVR